MSNCCLTGLPDPQVGGPATNPFVPCQDVPKIDICPPNGTTEMAFAGTGSTGAALSHTAAFLTSVEAVQPVDQYYKVLLVNSKDREFVTLCAPNGDRVVAQNVTPTEAPIGTAPTFEFWNLAGAAWVGDPTTLKDCGTEKIDITQASWFCANGASVSRTDFFSVETNTLVGSLWQDVTGTVIAAPANPRAGVCESQVVDILAGSLGIIAGSTLAATAEFTGAAASASTASIVGKVQSITVAAKGITDGTTSTDSVVVTLPSGVAMRLFDNQTFTWSVTRGMDDELTKPIVVTASGNAYANIGYTAI